MLVTCDNDKSAILSDLYLVSVKDYQDPILWKSFVEYLQEEVMDEDQWLSVERYREFALIALTATQQHFTLSHTIWNTVVETEIQLLEEGKSTVEFIRNSYLERLRIPHQGLMI